MFRSAEYPKVFDHPTISNIATLLQKSNAQVVLRFLIQLNVGVVPRSSDSQRQRQNLDVFGFSLNDDQMAQMEAFDTGKRIVYLPISAHSPHFPFGANCPDDRGQTEF
uniref:Aldo_ket_red domain-containing protein n=1 Tax=Globodera pallida TaxID=36090 RepID=A0A183CRJ5_GLOPA